MVSICFVLQAMSFLQKAIGLRGYGQKDPLTEYKLLGYRQYLEMMDNIRRNVIFNVFQFNPNMVKKRELVEQQQNQAKSNGTQKAVKPKQPAAA